MHDINRSGSKHTFCLKAVVLFSHKRHLWLEFLIWNLLSCIFLKFTLRQQSNCSAVEFACQRMWDNRICSDYAVNGKNIRSLRRRKKNCRMRGTRGEDEDCVARPAQMYGSAVITRISGCMLRRIKATSQGKCKGPTNPWTLFGKRTVKNGTI